MFAHISDSRFFSKNIFFFLWLRSSWRTNAIIIGHKTSTSIVQKKKTLTLNREMPRRGVVPGKCINTSLLKYSFQDKRFQTVQYV